MKKLHLLMIIALGLGMTVHTVAQPLIPARHAAKPLLFEQVPDRIECASGDLKTLLSLSKDEFVDLLLGEALRIRGRVLEKVTPIPGVQSVNLRLENFQNALFTLTARSLPGGSTVWSGRIHHFRFGDAFVLVWDKGIYVLQKRAQERLLPD